MNYRAQWFYAQNGKQFGPIDWEQLRETAASGQLAPSDLVWSEGLPDWTAAGRIGGIFIRPEQAASPGYQSQSNGNDHGGPAGLDFQWPAQVRHLVAALHKKVNEPVALKPHPASSVEPREVDRWTTALLAFFLGAFGIHKFLLGRTKQGVAMLAVTLGTFGVGLLATIPIAAIEGLLYALRSDEEFHRIYVVGRRAWF